MSRERAQSTLETEGSQTNGAASQAAPGRQWIGWDQPLLPNVAQRLLHQFGVGDTWDMRNVLLVLPGGLAQRRLTELLALTAKQHGKVLYPPQIVTLGTLPEQLYVAKYPFASDLIQQLAWVQALRSCPAAELAHLVPVPPAQNATPAWMELAKIFSGLHRELASDRLNFEQVVAALGNHVEAPRWRALAELQKRYLATLDELKLWDIQTARLCALQFQEATTTLQIIVIGCVDLNRTQRGFLEHVASQVSIWIAAPDSAAAMFDEYGSLLGAAWQDFEIEIPHADLLVGNSPKDQAELAAAAVAELGDRFHASEVTIGVPDAKLIGEIKHQFDQAGVTARFGPGTPLSEAEPALLLSLLGQYVDDRSFASFAALIRQPAVASMLSAKKISLPGNWLAQIDAYYQVALPKQVDSFVNQAACGADVYAKVCATINHWLRELTPRPRAISKWVQPLLDVLSTAYRQQTVDMEEPTQAALYNAASALCDALVALSDIPSQLEPTLTVSELIDWLLRGLAGTLIPEPYDFSAVEMLGWLDLGLDDAPALVIVGLHDGVVPESASGDAFLPNAMRRQLGMVDNARRYARDIYSLHLMLRSRQQVRIVVGKTDSNGDPLVPSRLLMACNLADLPDRVLHLVKEDAVDVLPAVKRRWVRRGGRSELPIPQPVAGRCVPHMTVTAFRTYLSCPYRFYLGHVLKLRDHQDSDVELDAPMFGNLIHDTLEHLGKGDISRCDEAGEVEQFLLQKLQSIALERYGPNPPSAVLIQIEQAEQRLKIFAPLQAARAAEGWEIRFTECAVDLSHQVLLGRGPSLPLIGRIDRIDYHPRTGQWAIWDYKTSDNAKQPLSVHWTKKDGWKDLQLPLYRPLARIFGVGETPSLGYIALPKQATDIGFHEAPFTSELLAEADELAHELAMRILAEDFWPEPLGEPKYDDFARICQTRVQQVSVDPPPRRLSRHRPLETSIPDEVVSAAQRLLQAGGMSPASYTPVLIRASAGTGKTFQLTNRLLQIILSGQEVDPILASTFTRKAAGEIMHRVLQRLAQGCTDEQSRQEMAQHLHGVDASAPACLAALRRVTRSIHRLRIGTLDSFFAQVARTFSLEMGLPPGWTALDPVQEPQVQLQAIGQMLDHHERRTLVELVRMLSKGDSARQISDQIRQTVENGFAVYRASSAEAWDQLPVPPAPSEAAVESALLTLEQAEVLNKTGTVNKNFKNNLEKLHLLARSGDWEAVICHGIFKNLDEDPPSYYRCPLDGSLVAALRLLAERAAAELLAIRRNQTLASYQVLKAYDSEYSALIRRRRALAFSDVTYYLSRWMSGTADLRNGPARGLRDAPANAAARLAFRLDCGVQHLLLDEFQDTAPEQWQILRPLASPLGGQPRSESSFFCVGDTKQAIYGWRGGVAEIFDSVGRSVAQLQESSMSDSYRSSPEVMCVVNEVFGDLTKHQNFSQCDVVAQQWSKEFPEHRTSRAGLVGYVQLQNGPAVDSSLTAEQKKELYLEIAARQIAQLTEQSSASIGVLFRTNADVGRMISLLRARGVPASQDGGNPLSDSAAVELLLSLVHLADHPGDGICAFHVENSPLAAALPYSAATEPGELAAWFRQEVSRRGLGRALESVAEPLADKLGWWDQYRLEQFFRAAYDYQPSYTGRLRDFEEAVLRNRVPLPTEAQVKVMTVHKSKGLEFDAVFLPELDIELSSSNSLFVLRGSDPCEPPDGVVRYMNSNLQSMLPHSWQQAFAVHKQRGVAESLCLLYVAMTRARQALYMLARPTKSDALQQFGSLLQSTLGQGPQRLEPGAVVYERGDPKWYLTKPRADAKQQGESQQDRARSAYSVRLRQDAGSAPERRLRVTAPSQLQSESQVLQLANAFSSKHSQGAIHGALLHAFFEQVRWLEEYRFDRQVLRRVALKTLPPEALQHISIEATTDEFRNLLELDCVRSALSKRRYQSPVLGMVPDSVEVDNERVVSLVMDRKLVAGTIDRLVVLFKDGRPYAAEIFDFKTDKFDSRAPLLWLDERVEHHRPQLEIYARVVCELLALPRSQVMTYLVMLGGDRLIGCDSPVSLSR